MKNALGITLFLGSLTVWIIYLNNTKLRQAINDCWNDKPAPKPDTDFKNEFYDCKIK